MTDKINTEHDTPAQPTEVDAKVVDNAHVETKEPTEDEAILAAIRGEEAPNEGGDENEGKEAKNGSAKPQDDGDGKDEKKQETKDEEQSALDKENSDDMKGRTKERFNAVLEEGKKWREEANQYKQQLEQVQPQAEWGGQVIKMLGESGGTAEDLASGIAIIHAVVRGTTENKIRALEEVEKIRVTLSSQLGRPISGVSHLNEFADLQKKVDDGEISPSDAEELAAARKAARLRQAREDEEETRRRQKFDEEQQTGQHQQALQQAQQSIENLANQYLKADGQEVYETRVQYAMSQVKMLKEMGTTVEPAKLPDVFTRFYKSAEADSLVQAKTLAKARVSTGARPVMGNRMGGSGSASKEPGSMDEAILAAIRGE